MPKLTLYATAFPFSKFLLSRLPSPRVRIGHKRNEEMYLVKVFKTIINRSLILVSILLVFNLEKYAAGAPQIEWIREYGGPEAESARFVQEIDGKGYIFTGSTGSVSTNFNVYLVKTDLRGNVQWERSLGGDDDDFAYCVQRSVSGGYIVVGETNSYGAGYYDVWLQFFS